MVNAWVDGTQDCKLTLSFKGGTRIRNSRDSLNSVIISLEEVITDSLIDDDLDLEEVVEDESDSLLDSLKKVDDNGNEFYEDFTDKYFYDIYFVIKTHINGQYDYDPGVRTYSNGDPGYPPSCDWEAYSGWADKFDKNKLVEGIKSIEGFGEYVEGSSISFTIGDVNEGEEIKFYESQYDY